MMEASLQTNSVGTCSVHYVQQLSIHVHLECLFPFDKNVTLTHPSLSPYISPVCYIINNLTAMQNLDVSVGKTTLCSALCSAVSYWEQVRIHSIAGSY